MSGGSSKAACGRHLTSNGASLASSGEGQYDQVGDPRQRLQNSRMFLAVFYMPLRRDEWQRHIIQVLERLGYSASRPLDSSTGPQSKNCSIVPFILYPSSSQFFKTWYHGIFLDTLVSHGGLFQTLPLTQSTSARYLDIELPDNKKYDLVTSIPLRSFSETLRLGTWF